MKKLRIAVTADTMPEISHVTNIIRAPFSPRQLVEVIAELDAIPVVLPDVTGACGEDYVELFDGLIIPGGPDIDPRFFGEQPFWALGRTNYKRDVFEIGLVQARTARASRFWASAEAASSSTLPSAVRFIRTFARSSPKPTSSIRSRRLAPIRFTKCAFWRVPRFIRPLAARRRSTPATTRPSTRSARDLRQQPLRPTVSLRVLRAPKALRLLPCSGTRKTCGSSMKK